MASLQDNEFACWYTRQELQRDGPLRQAGLNEIVILLREGAVAWMLLPGETLQPGTIEYNHAVKVWASALPLRFVFDGTPWLQSQDRYPLALDIVVEVAYCRDKQDVFMRNFTATRRRILNEDLRAWVREPLQRRAQHWCRARKFIEATSPVVVKRDDLKGVLREALNDDLSSTGLEVRAVLTEGPTFIVHGQTTPRTPRSRWA